MTIRKAVFPAAGLGTRFLPATKAQPKEMLPIVDKPTIQYVVEEAAASGIQDIIVVTGRGKNAIEDHFDRSIELEVMLSRKGRTDLLEVVRRVSELVRVCYVRQKEPLGLGHAVWCAREIVGDEPFAVLLPDMVTMASGPGKSRCLAQCIEAYETHGGNIIAVEEVTPDETHKYGVVAVGEDHDTSFEITGMVEKPARGTAPSNLIISGRYVLSPEIFDILGNVEKGAGGEIQLTDGMKELSKSQSFHGVRFDGATYDCGSKLGFLTANVAFALADTEIAPGFRQELRKLLG